MFLMIALLFLILPATVRAEDGSYLYLVTTPMGATVYLNGEALASPSPLLLRNMPTGSYLVRVEKDGWYDQSARIELPAERTKEFDLVPREPLAHMEGYRTPAGENPDARATGSATIRFSSDALIFEPGEEGIVVAPVFPKQRLLDGVKMSLPLFLALTGVLTAREIYSPRDSDLVLAPELIASSLMGSGLFVWNVLLESERARFLRDHRIREASWEGLSLSARLRFEAAEEALAGGNFEVALSRFSELVDDYPDDPVMPRALFEIGRILIIKDDIAAAAEVYRTIAERYPLPDLHDRARKALADCLAEEGNLEGALEQLKLLSFNGSGLTREEVQLYRDLF